MKSKLDLLGNYNLGIALICGGICALLGITERFICGAPYTVIHTLGISGLLPPVWLMAALCLSWLFLVGGVLGAVMSEKCATVKAIRGCLFALLSLSVGFFWYPLFFNSTLLLPAFLCIVAVTASSVISALLWYGENFLPSLVMWLYSAWCVYLLILSLAIVGR